MAIGHILLILHWYVHSTNLSLPARLVASHLSHWDALMWPGRSRRAIVVGLSLLPKLQTKKDITIVMMQSGLATCHILTPESNHWNKHAVAMLHKAYNCSLVSGVFNSTAGNWLETTVHASKSKPTDVVHDQICLQTHCVCHTCSWRCCCCCCHIALRGSSHVVARVVWFTKKLQHGFM